MSTFLKITLIVFVVLTILFGLPLLGMPGRFLAFFGWAPVDPLISRMLGAALLSMAWIGWRAVRSNTRQAAQPVIEVASVFCALSAIGLLWQVKGTYWPWMVWIVLALYLVLAAAWLVNWIKK